LIYILFAESIVRILKFFYSYYSIILSRSKTQKQDLSACFRQLDVKIHLIFLLLSIY